jgi:hypothetical protein
MMRTTLTLPVALHQQLIIASKQEGKSLSELARDLIDFAMTTRQKPQIKHTYSVLREIEGICTDPATDVSTTIDETLYGEDGAWKGRNAQNL